MTRTLLPVSWYIDPAAYQRDRQRIFARNWALFGPEAGLREPRSWRADTVNGWPLFVIRGDDGILRGFHNVCRHRAAKLLADGTGACARIVCPYHAWTYDLTGALRKAPNFGPEDALDLAAHGLFPVRVEIWNELVFVCLDDEAPGLAAWLGSLPALCDEFPKPADLALDGGFSAEGDCNWKAYCENTVEGYHLPTVHRRLNAAVDRANTQIEAYDEGRLVVFHVTYAGGDTTLRGNQGIWFYRFPGFQGVAGARSFKAERIEPISPTRMKLTNWSWFASLSPEEKADSIAWNRQITREDMGICETVQRNFEAGVYHEGVLSPLQEGHLARLQALVLDAIDGAGGHAS
ncbi:MAG TPA: aromatic ring-hydroxylating dioxygenase subunit alpha [Hypericibacter adhaerens]|uniref:(2Fe-2S)-binding protein n=1 Tax=Hypericibacter adhaerens TaxID=2602016 RepID=A0A5J6MW49_9PROT|nr:aromatic ring-hydroxylating dioxygenase subunit alpha [Hypericibacter adhaerens]QEX21481.1 (2Fe-2S)-binding protein [Hypericibacter adhaerens]HWA45639.1 aromatic ring-hydroxylating dioxygenase subunit alpha [Hypericibacter adhaerens]